MHRLPRLAHRRPRPDAGERAGCAGELVRFGCEL